LTRNLQHSSPSGDRTASSTLTWFGALFESLATQTIPAYADARDTTTAHLRIRNGACVIDLSVEGADRRLIAIELKLAPTVGDSDVRHLNWLRTKLGDQLFDRLAITTGSVAYRRLDGSPLSR
jgi:hypothetical protein